MGAIRRWLEKSHPVVVHIYIIVTIFCAYLSVYFIRGPVFAAFFKNKTIFNGFDLKTALATSQVIGYALGKPPSLLLSPLLATRSYRPYLLSLLVFLAGSSLLLLPISSIPIFQCLSLVFVGFFLSPVWGGLVNYMEGRRGTEAVIALTSLSYITGGALGKTAGAYSLALGMSEEWMPAALAAAAVFLFILLIFFVDQIPDPSIEDVIERKKRSPPTLKEVVSFMRQLGFGIMCVLFAYTLGGAARLFRDFFTVELWQEILDAEADPSLYSKTELPVAVGVLLTIGLVFAIKNHKSAFLVMLAVIAGGLIIALGATILHSLGLLSGGVWFVAVGCGLFISLVPPGAMLWDRLMASTKREISTTFLVYIGDGVSYIATLTMLISKNFTAKQSSPVEFFTTFVLAATGCAIALVGLAALFFFVVISRAEKKEVLLPTSASSGQNSIEEDLVDNSIEDDDVSLMGNAVKE